MNARSNTRFALLEGGLWLPGVLPDDGARLSRSDLVQTYARQNERVRRQLEENGPLRRLIVEGGLSLNLRPPGFLPTLPFLPLLQVRTGEKRVQALKSADGWMLEGRLDDLDGMIQEAQWHAALMGDQAIHDWQASVAITEDDVEAEALAVLVGRRGTLPLPGGHHLLQVHPDRGMFLLTGPRVGVRVLTTFWKTEAVRLARAALLENWAPLSERQMLAVFRPALPDDVRVEQSDRDRWQVCVNESVISLNGHEQSWVVGQRRIPRRTEQPDRLTLLWAIQAATQRRARRFWRMARADDRLALARSKGVSLAEGVVTYNLIRRQTVCPDCRACFVLGDACLNPACPSRRGADDCQGAPLVHIRGGVFVYAPDQPGWVEERNGKIGGVVGDELIQTVPPERIVVRQATERTALLIARLTCFVEQQLPITPGSGGGEIKLPLPSPSSEAIGATRQIIREKAPFASRFVEALKGLTA